MQTQPQQHLEDCAALLYHDFIKYNDATPIAGLDHDHLQGMLLTFVEYFKYYDKFPFGKLRKAFVKQLDRPDVGPVTRYDWLCKGFLIGIEQGL